MVATNSRSGTRYRIPTSAGSLFFPLTGNNGELPMVPLYRNGKLIETYVTEVSGGDRIVGEVEGVPEESADFSDILGILNANVPGYQQTRAANFIELGFLGDKRTYEVPRLKYDLWHAVAEKNPSLFTADELAHLDDCIFSRADGENTAYGFSRKTVSNVSGYIEKESEAACAQEGVEWKYKPGGGAVESWLNGDVIHPTHNSDKPEDLQSAIWIAYSMGSAELLDRSLGIYDAAAAAQEDPAAKGANDYFRLVDGHGIVTKLMRGMIGEDKHEKRKPAMQATHGIVYNNTREWADAVRQELKARIEHGIKEITVYDKGELVDVGNGDAPQGHTQGMSRKPILITSEGERDGVYDKLGIKSKPASRRDTLKRALMDAADIMTDAYGKLVQTYTTFKRNPDTIAPVGSNFVLVERDGRKYVVLSPAYLQIFLPGTDGQLFIDEVIFEDKLIVNSITDPKFRREVKRQLGRNETIEDDGVNNHIRLTYQASPVLQSAISQKEFVRMFLEDRNRELSNTLDVAASHVSNHVKRTQTEYAFRRFIRESHQLREKSLKTVDTELGMMREQDKRIPIEIGMFRVVPLFLFSDRVLKRYGAASVDKLYDDVLAKHGLDSRNVREYYDKIILKNLEQADAAFRELEQARHLQYHTVQR